MPRQGGQGVFPYLVETVDDATAMTAHAGLPLVIETMRALGLPAAIREHLKLRQRDSGFSELEKVEALVLLLASGGECVEDIKVLRADQGLLRLIGRSKLPSASRLLQFLYLFHDDKLIEQAKARRKPGEVAYIPDENAALQGLALVNLALVLAVAAQSTCRRATLDHDATIQEAHKREALPHYKGGVGYQPSAIYWAEQDLVLADEYRDGNVPAGMQNLPLIKRGFAALPPAVTEFFFRGDSACYDERVLKWLANPEREDGPSGFIGFTISADMSPELHHVCAAVAESEWKPLEERADETVSCCEVEFTPGDWPKESSPLRYLALRIRKRQGLLFAGGYDTKYLAVVTNRKGEGPELIRWHWQKAGTIELVHDVSKNELAARMPPCGRFGANAAWYRLALLTYNVLSAMKSLALPAQLSTARPKRLRFSVFNIAGRIVSRAGRMVLRIGTAAERIAGLIAARLRLLALLAPPRPAPT